MLAPGYYLVIQAVSLRNGGHKITLHRGDWLVTNGVLVGRFDKQVYLDWAPLEWGRGTELILNEELATTIDGASTFLSLARLERMFQALVFVDENDPVPPMPTPPLRALGTYLRVRRTLLAKARQQTYDHR